MGLYDITIFNATGGNRLSFNKEQKNTEPRLSTCWKTCTVFRSYIVLIGIRNEIYKILVTPCESNYQQNLTTITSSSPRTHATAYHNSRSSKTRRCTIASRIHLAGNRCTSSPHGFGQSTSSSPTSRMSRVTRPQNGQKRMSLQIVLHSNSI